jgi:serine/threonine protein kinase/dipeptidyl aminopeptidase/acylaminoacyl peptidase
VYDVENMAETRLGRFILLGKLGEGGMGVVYKARDTLLNRDVALKVLPLAKADDAERRARLLKEAQAASALRHANIVIVYEFGEEAGQQYVVMELVEGKPLNELIPSTGMPVPQVLKAASQVAGALAAAHEAGIVHRDLKPANIMMDGEGRVKVLDFGIAKLAGPEPADDEATRTAGLTREGAIIGSASYMSPEQARGWTVDARSDIFSFGSLVYEMLTGRQAFPGESVAARMVAVLEREPVPLTGAAPGTPPELERLVSRCLRKDVALRSQHIADVKVALDELREDSDTRKPTAATPPYTDAPPPRRWLWPVVAGACAVVAAGAIAWTLANRRGVDTPAVPEMTRLSPDDGHSYTEPDISPDGKLVAYVSNRGGGKDEIWLQQAAGGQPIQVTRSQQPAHSPSFLPDGAQIVYVARPESGNLTFPGTLEIVPAFGGPSRVLTKGVIVSPKASPDGRSVLFFEWAENSFHLATIPVEGGTVKRLDTWRRMQRGSFNIFATWSPDSRSILASVSDSGDERETYAFPLDGVGPTSTGITAAFRAVDVGVSVPSAIFGERAFFAAAKGNETSAIWELRLDAGSWRPRGTPRRLTLGTEHLRASGVSSAGVAATQSTRSASDFHLIAMDWRTGHAVAPARRLTRDGRSKFLYGRGGDPALAYGRTVSLQSGYIFSIDLATASQAVLMPGPFSDWTPVVSHDAKLVAMSRADGDGRSISLSTVGTPLAAARQLCSKCGRAIDFSPDGRYLLYDPSTPANIDPKARRSLGVIEVATGKATPWLDDPTDSITGGGFLASEEWFGITLAGSDESKPLRRFVIPWRVPAPPRSEWVEYSIPATRGTNLQSLPGAPFIHYFDGPKLMAIRFDPAARRFGEPFQVRFPPGHESDLQPGDSWRSRGPGIVFTRLERTGSVWLMKLPE